MFVAILTLILRWIWIQWRRNEDAREMPEVHHPPKKKEKEEAPPREMPIGSEEEDEPPPMPAFPRRREGTGRSRAAGSARGADPQGDPNRDRHTWRRPRLYIAPTGVKYHFKEECAGLQNARFVSQVYWCQTCRNVELLHGRQLYVRASGYPVHLRFWAQCAVRDEHTRELEPCSVCVPRGWPDGERA